MLIIYCSEFQHFLRERERKRRFNVRAKCPSRARIVHYKCLQPDKSMIHVNAIHLQIVCRSSQFPVDPEDFGIHRSVQSDCRR